MSVINYESNQVFMPVVSYEPNLLTVDHSITKVNINPARNSEFISFLIT